MGTIHCWLDVNHLLVTGLLDVLHLFVEDFLVRLGSYFEGSLIQVQSVPSVSRRKLGDVIITHLVASLTGLIIILMLTIVISPAESLIWGLPPCRQVFVTVCLFSCILLVVHKNSAVEINGICVWSWDRCCCVISFPI